MTNAELLEAKGINLKNRKTGTIKTQCPECSANRRNKKDPSLSVNIDEGLYNCHHCDFRGRVFERKIREYVKPVARLEKLSPKMLMWFEGERKISNNTLLRFQITESREWMPQFEAESPVICFNYFRNEQLVNIKFRGPKKSFRMEKDAELIFYNLNSILDEEECVIVEGEMDCLAMYESGVYNVVSVPNGASKGSQQLEYLNNCWQWFEHKKKIILAVDGDVPGQILRSELSRRLGKEKCYTVDYPEGCKDANDVLINHGKETVKKLITSATAMPIEGIKTMAEMYPTIVDWYEHGYPKGAKTKIPGFDDLLTFVPGQLTVVTGIPGHGKDEFTDWIMSSLAMLENWSFGICGFEETPEETTTKIIEKICGKSFNARSDPSNRISQKEFDYGMGMVEKYFYFVNPDEIETDLPTLLEKGEELVMRYGIKGYCLNPWNWIEHERPAHLTETEYIGMALSKIIRFARKCQVHVFLLAHTTKISKGRDGKKYEVPNLYSISGSANFFNKTHNGITIYRDYSTNQVDVYVQKVKQSWLGRIGFCTFHYNIKTRQYDYLNGIDKSEVPEQKWKPISQTANLFGNPDKFIESNKEDLPF